MKFAVDCNSHLGTGSPPSRGAWIEIEELPDDGGLVGSPPSRGAWIEISYSASNLSITIVAPLAGGVD